MRSFRPWAQPGALAFAVGLAFLANSQPVHAAVVNWLGGTPCDLANPVNWQGGALPAVGDEVDFNVAGCHGPTSAGNFNVRYFRLLDGGYTIGGTGTISIGGPADGGLYTVAGSTGDTVFNVASLMLNGGSDVYASGSNLIINTGTLRFGVVDTPDPYTEIGADDGDLTITPTADFSGSVSGKYLYLETSTGRTLTLTNGITATDQLASIEIYNLSPGGKVVLGNSTNFTCWVDIWSSDLEITGNNSLGDPGDAGYTWVSGSGYGWNGTGALILSNNLTGVPEFIWVGGRADFSFPQIRNRSGDNTLSGHVGLDVGGDYFALQSDGTAAGDILRVACDVFANNSVVHLSLQGPGKGTITGAITQPTGTLNLEKNGTGTWTLAGTNTYTSTTTVNQGTLALTGAGSIATSSSITVKSGATLNVSDLSSGALTLAGSQSLKGAGTVTGNLTAGSGNTILPGDGVGTMTVSGNLNLTGGSALQYEMNVDPAAANDKIVGGGNLTMAGVTTLNVIGSLTDGLYRLFDVTGTITATPANFTVNVPAATVGQTFEIVINTATTPRQVNLQVQGSRQLTWVGGQGGNAWDVNSTPNWTGSDTRFLNGDLVTFDDTGVFSSPVNISTAVTPGRVAFSNTATHDYTLTGGDISVVGDLSVVGSGKVTLANTGTINVGGTINVTSGTLALDRADDVELPFTFAGAGALRKEGAKTVTIDGVSPGFTGPMTVASGTLQGVGPNALGAGGSMASGTTVLDGATLDVIGFGAGEPAVEPVSIIGTGVGGAGALVKSQGDFGYVNGIELTGNAKMANPLSGTYMGVNGSGAFIHGNGHDLDVVIADAGGPTGNNYTEVDWLDVGDVSVNNLNVSGSGALYLVGDCSLLGPSGTLTLNDKSRLGFVVGYTGTISKPMVIAPTGGGLELYDAGTVTVNSPVTMNGDFEVGLWADDVPKIVLTGKLTGPGSLHPTALPPWWGGDGVVAVTSDANDYTGPTIIGGGGGKIGSTADYDPVTLSVGDGGATGRLGPGDVIVNWILSLNRTGTYSFPNNISGPGDVDCDAAGAVVSLTGNLTYTGITRVDAGTLKANTNGLHTTGVLYMVAGGATLDLTSAVASPLTTGGLLLHDNAALSFRLATPASTTDDTIVVTGTADLSAVTTLTVNATHVGGGPLPEGYYLLISSAAMTTAGTPALDFHGPAGQTAHLTVRGPELYLTIGNPPLLPMPPDIEPAGGDGDVDIQDYLAAFGTCVSGPAVPLAPGCEVGDLDQDGDVDQSDFGIWQSCFSGTDTQAEHPRCTYVQIP